MNNNYYFFNTKTHMYTHICWYKNIEEVNMAFIHFFYQQISLLILNKRDEQQRKNDKYTQ